MIIPLRAHHNFFNIKFCSFSYNNRVIKLRKKQRWNTCDILQWNPWNVLVFLFIFRDPNRKPIFFWNENRCIFGLKTTSHNIIFILLKLESPERVNQVEANRPNVASDLCISFLQILWFSKKNLGAGGQNGLIPRYTYFPQYTNHLQG
jgi:hypothetical protein